MQPKVEFRNITKKNLTATEIQSTTHQRTKTMPPRRDKDNSTKRGRSKTEKATDSVESDDDDEYRKKRDRNNQVRTINTVTITY